MQEVDYSDTYNDDDQNGPLFTFATRIRKYGDVKFYIVTINLNVLILNLMCVCPCIVAYAREEKPTRCH